MNSREEQELALLIAAVVLSLAWYSGLLGGMTVAGGLAAVAGIAYIMFGQQHGGGPAYTAATTGDPVE